MDLLKKIFTNDKMYYSIGSLAADLMGWIKKLYDSKLANKRMEHWKIKYKKECPFLKIAKSTYDIDVAFLFILILSYSAFFQSPELKFWQQITLSIICYVLHLILIAIQLKRPTVRIELLKHKKRKIFMLLIIGIIVFFPILLMNSLIAIIIWWMALLLWFALIITFSDKIITYNRSYADIYMSGGMEIKGVRTNQIWKQGNWIHIQKSNGGHTQELKIRKNSLERIDYFGDPLIIIKQFRCKK